MNRSIKLSKHFFSLVLLTAMIFPSFAWTNAGNTPTFKEEPFNQIEISLLLSNINNEKITLEVLDKHENHVYSKTYEAKRTFHKTVNLSNLNTGDYHLLLKVNESVYSRRVFVR